MSQITESYRCILCRKTGLIKHDIETPLALLSCPNCKETELYFDLNQSISFYS